MKPRDAGGLGGLSHVVGRRVRTDVADVLLDGRVQQRRLLLDEDDVPADAFERAAIARSCPSKRTTPVSGSSSRVAR